MILQLWKVHRFTIVSVCALAAMVLNSYHPVLLAGFWSDDFQFIEIAGRSSWLEYLAFYWDPTRAAAWFRPLQGMQWGIEYLFFKTDGQGYHIVQAIYHLMNVVLVYAIVLRVTRNWRVGLLSALFYVSWGVYGVAVFWVGVPDPLATLLGLLAIRLWISYLDNRTWQLWIGALLAFSCALLTKEVTATLPAILLLVDAWLVSLKPSWYVVIKRNAIFFGVLVVYILLEYTVLTKGTYQSDSGYGIGAHILQNIIGYATLFAFPWNSNALLSWIALAISAAVFLVGMVKRKWQIVFLIVVAGLSVLPVLPFHGVGLRYLYIPLMVSAVAYGALAEKIFMIGLVRIRSIAFLRIVIVLVAGILGWVFINGSLAITDSAVAFSGNARLVRLVFRPIYTKYPTFPSGTQLIFIDPPLPHYNVSGIMFIRYGANVTVQDMAFMRATGLRNQLPAYVFYFDDAGAIHDQPVSSQLDAHVAVSLPARFGDSIMFDGFELVNDTVTRGDALIATLYWQTAQALSRDYTIFAHLIAPDGNMVAGYDSLPRKGLLPTSQWKLNVTLGEHIILPIDGELSPSADYQLDIGMYDLQTMQRLPLRDANGQTMGDTVRIGPIRIR